LLVTHSVQQKNTTVSASYCTVDLALERLSLVARAQMNYDMAWRGVQSVR